MPALPLFEEQTDRLPEKGRQNPVTVFLAAYRRDQVTAQPGLFRPDRPGSPPGIVCRGNLQFFAVHPAEQRLAEGDQPVIAVVPAPGGRPPLTEAGGVAEL